MDKVDKSHKPGDDLEDSLSPAAAPAAEGALEMQVVDNNPRNGGAGMRLRAGNKKCKAKGAENREQSWDLVIRQGLPISQAAKKLGLSYKTVWAHYTARLDEILEAQSPNGPNADRYRLEVEEHLREELGKAKEQSADDPRYAAIALKTLEQLARLWGVDKGPTAEVATETISAQEISDKLRLMSPALAGRKEQLERILEGQDKG